MHDIQHEIEFFDAKADELISQEGYSLQVDSPYAHLSGSKNAFDYFMTVLGDVTGKIIMDVGAGSGWLSVFLARRNAAYVYGFDVSPKMIDIAQKRAVINNVAPIVEFGCHTAEEGVFENNRFDYVVGISVLHHIRIPIFKHILYKTLKPKGKSVFIEPLGENPIVEFIRNVIFRGGRTHTEKPLTFSDIDNFDDLFTIESKVFQLFGGLSRLIGDKTAKILGLNALDDILFQRFPSLRKYARIMVLVLIPRAEAAR